MAVSLTINGTDYTSYFVDGHLRQTALFRLRICELVLADDDADTLVNALDNGQDVQVSVDGTLRFRGIVEDYEFDEDRQVTIYAIDYSYYLAEQYITYAASNEVASTIVANLIANYGNSQFTTNIVSTTNQYTKTWRAASPLEIMQELALIEGFVVFVDENRVLHFVPNTSNDTGITLVDGTDIFTRKFPSVGTKLKNKIVVIGRGGTSNAGIKVVVRDPSSIAKYGERTFRLEDGDLTSEDAAYERGIAELSRRANPLITGEVETALDFRLAAGALVRITLPQKGWTAKQFLIIEAEHMLDLPVTKLQLAEINVLNSDQLAEILASQRAFSKHFEDDDTPLTAIEQWIEQVTVTVLYYVEKQSTAVRRTWNEGAWNAQPAWNHQDSNWTIVITEEQGLITNNGLNRLRDLIMGEAVTPLNAANANIAIGTGTTPPTAADTALQAEAHRKAMDSGFPRDGNIGEAEFQGSWSDADFISGSFSEIGLLDAATGGMLVARIVPSTNFVKNANELLRVRTKIKLESA